MTQITLPTEYDALIKRIKRKRKMVVAITIIALAVTVVMCFPAHLVILDKTLIDHQGIHPLLTILLVLLICFIQLIVYAFVSMPVATSMDFECDPQKHLTLNIALNQQKNKDHIFAVDFFYMGKFREALEYAERMTADSNLPMRLVGLFNKARCEFFLEDFDALKTTVGQYETTLNSADKMNKKTKDAYEKMQKTLRLLVAIADADQQNISELCDVDVWSTSKATQGYINYLRGVAAVHLNDKQQAVYKFMDVKENASKTVFAQLAEHYLSQMNLA